MKENELKGLLSTYVFGRTFFDLVGLPKDVSVSKRLTKAIRQIVEAIC